MLPLSFAPVKAVECFSEFAAILTRMQPLRHELHTNDVAAKFVVGFDGWAQGDLS